MDHIRKLVDLWVARYEELSKDEKIKYVFIFENRGEVVGVTMPPPTRSDLRLSLPPQKLELEVENAAEYYREKGRCLFCDMREQEVAFRQRIIFQNEHFTVFLPFFTEYPYGVYIISNHHRSNMTQFTAEERRSLAETLKNTTGMLDSLFGYKFPYMMCLYNEPVNGPDASEFSIFTLPSIPPMRSADKVKFNASSETGAWAHCNPTCPEENRRGAAGRIPSFSAKINRSCPPRKRKDFLFRGVVVFCKKLGRFSDYLCISWQMSV